MAQEASQLTTAPPLPGLTMVQEINKIAKTIATDFAGPADPAAMAWPYATWADTGNMLLKRRNGANSAWAVEGALLSYGSASLTFKAAPSDANDDVIVQGQAFGVAQTWQNLTATRTTGTIYTNTTGKPIAVSIFMTFSGGMANAFAIDVGLNRVALAYNPAITGADWVVPLFAVVPAGETYVASVVNGSPSSFSWLELRA